MISAKAVRDPPGSASVMALASVTGFQQREFCPCLRLLLLSTLLHLSFIVLKSKSEHVRHHLPFPRN